ncbi:MAG: hypothetical protein V7713_18080, partial [Marinobacter sp.]
WLRSRLASNTEFTAFKTSRQVPERNEGLLSQTRRKPIPGGLILPSMARHSLGKQALTAFT